MPTPIVIKIGDLELKGEFNDTPAGQAAAQALPFEWSGSRWGDEYYGPPGVDFGGCRNLYFIAAFKPSMVV